MPQRPSKSIEQIAREVGRYRLDAFLFVHESIAIAAEKVHGPMTEDQKAIVQWMAQHEMGPDELIAQANEGKLPPDIMRAIKTSGGVRKMNRHVTGQQLCGVLRDIARERWGMLARTVLARWNLNRTEDFGVIVFALVNHHWLQKQPADSIDDFNNVYSFDEAFGPLPG